MIDIHYWEDCQVNLQFFHCLGSNCRYSRSGALLSTVQTHWQPDGKRGGDSSLPHFSPGGHNNNLVSNSDSPRYKAFASGWEEERTGVTKSRMSASDRGGWLGSWAVLGYARMEEAGRRLWGNIGAGVRSSGDSGCSPATPHTTQPGGRRGVSRYFDIRCPYFWTIIVCCYLFLIGCIENLSLQLIFSRYQILGYESKLWFGFWP